MIRGAASARERAELRKSTFAHRHVLQRRGRGARSDRQYHAGIGGITIPGDPNGVSARTREGRTRNRVRTVGGIDNIRVVLLPLEGERTGAHDVGRERDAAAFALRLVWHHRDAYICFQVQRGAVGHTSADAAHFERIRAGLARIHTGDNERVGVLAHEHKAVTSPDIVEVARAGHIGGEDRIDPRTDNLVRES